MARGERVASRAGRSKKRRPTSSRLGALITSISPLVVVPIDEASVSFAGLLLNTFLSSGGASAAFLLERRLAPDQVLFVEVAGSASGESLAEDVLQALREWHDEGGHPVLRREQTVVLLLAVPNVVRQVLERFPSEPSEAKEAPKTLSPDSEPGAPSDIPPGWRALTMLDTGETVLARDPSISSDAASTSDSAVHPLSVHISSDRLRSPWMKELWGRLMSGADAGEAASDLTGSSETAIPEGVGEGPKPKEGEKKEEGADGDVLPAAHPNSQAYLTELQQPTDIGGQELSAERERLGQSGSGGILQALQSVRAVKAELERSRARLDAALADVATVGVELAETLARGEQILRQYELDRISQLASEAACLRAEDAVKAIRVGELTQTASRDDRAPEQGLLFLAAELSGYRTSFTRKMAEVFWHPVRDECGGPDVLSLNDFLLSIAGKQCETPEKKQNFARALSRLLREVGCCLKCPKCNKPSKLVVAARKSRSGSWFAFAHLGANEGTSHGAGPLIPKLVLLPQSDLTQTQVIEP